VVVAGTGSAALVGSPVRDGSSAVQVGLTAPSGDSTIRQNITATDAGHLSSWYSMVCHDQVRYDWFDAWVTT